uniref:Peptidase_M16 domain-containing protein n=1 Tax=Syphacia muris TaxID=451379 RepID=A0A0N5AUN2_9BILA
MNTSLLYVALFLVVFLRLTLFKACQQCLTASQVFQRSTLQPKITVLDNGLKVVSENNGKPFATVGVWIDSGVSCENDANNGISNFLQHLFFKGTEKRTPTKLRNDLLKVGSRLSSYVDRDRVVIYINLVESVDISAVDIIADVLLNSKFDNEAIELERCYIMKEIEVMENDPLSGVFDLLHKAAFQETRMERSLLGTLDTVKNLDRTMLKNFLAERYIAPRMALVGVGGVEHATLIDLSKKYFHGLKARSRHLPGESEIRFTGSEVRYRDDSLPYMYGAVAVEGFEFGHPDIIPLQVAQTIVGEWDQTVAHSKNLPSRLARKVCSISDVLSYKCFLTTYKNCGLFGLYFTAKGENIAYLVTFLRAYMSTSVTDEDVECAKNMLKANIFGTMESNFGRADYIGRSVLISLGEIENRINAVNKKMIRDTVMRDVYDRDIVVSAIGRTEAFPDYLLLRCGMSWWRL